jgi:hypothetical protein
MSAHINRCKDVKTTADPDTLSPPQQKDTPTCLDMTQPIELLLMQKDTDSYDIKIAARAEKQKKKRNE